MNFDNCSTWSRKYEFKIYLVRYISNRPTFISKMALMHVPLSQDDQFHTNVNDVNTNPVLNRQRGVIDVKISTLIK